MARNGLSKRKRFEVLKREGFCCRYCGRSSPDVVMHVDHVIPLSAGGSHDIDNLIAACEACNLGKGPIKLTETVDWKSVVEQRLQQHEDDAWDVIDVLKLDRVGQGKSIPKDWLTGTQSLLRRVGKDELLQVAADTALAYSGRKRDRVLFLMFCKDAWALVRSKE